jgi:hypothetical protein
VESYAYAIAVVVILAGFCFVVWWVNRNEGLPQQIKETKVKESDPPFVPYDPILHGTKAIPLDVPDDEDAKIAEELARHTAEAAAAVVIASNEAAKAAEEKLTNKRRKRIAAHALKASAALALAAKVALSKKKKGKG